MADLRSTGSGRPAVSRNKSPTERDDEPNLSISNALGSAPRGTRSNVGPKNPGAHRSQTIPASTTEPQPRKAPATSATLPPPKPDHSSRTPSNTSPQPSTQRPAVSNPHNLLAGTDYRIEPLSGEQKDGLWLSPPDVRQSGSSFQTEPSSYYSADDYAVSSGPPPPMPQPQTADSRYESLWQATQAPPMPMPSLAPPSMPSPYGEEERSSGYIQTSEDDPHARSTLHYDDPSSHHDPRDTYNSSWLAAPSPGMPVPSAASRTARPVREDMPEIDNRPSYRIENSSSEVNTGDNINIPSTAPLRVHHHSHTRPTAAPPIPSPSPSTASRPAAQSSALQDQSGKASSRIQTGQPTSSTFGGQTGQAGSRPTGATAIQRADFIEPVNATLKPQAERPTAVQPRPTAPTSSAIAQRPTPILQNSSRFDSAPVQSKPTGPATTAASGTSAKPNSSIYAQYNTNRLDSQTQGNGAAKPLAHATTSTRPEARPTVQANTTPSSAAAQKPLPIRNQSTAYHSESNQPTRPAGAGPSAFSASAPPKPSQTQNQQQQSTHNSSPHVAEASRPQTVSAPPPQPKPPLSSANSNLKKKGDAAAHAADATNAMPTRPHLRGDPTQMDTEYVNMMLALDAIPALHNILAGFFNWILLAGFILFPGTFSNLQKLGPAVSTQVGEKLIHGITSLPLFIVAWVCCGIGAAGMIWLWWRWRKNYLWGLNKIFLPGLMNSLAGLISTLANIYGAQQGELSTPGKSTLIVTTASTGVFLIFTAFYTFWLVRRVKARHDRQVGKERAGKYGEGVVDLSKRKA